MQHVNLKGAWLCIDCEAIFDFYDQNATENCPVCASAEIWPLGRWLKPLVDIKIKSFIQGYHSKDAIISDHKQAKSPDPHSKEQLRA